MKKLLALLGLGLVLVGGITGYRVIENARINHLLETYVLQNYGEEYGLRNVRTITNGDDEYVIDVVNEHGERYETDIVVKLVKEY